MSNTITAVIPTLYEALDQIQRELVGFVSAVYRNSSAERAAVGQTITYPVVPAATTGDITPGQTPPDDGDQTIGSGSMTISKSKYSPVRWNGEEQVALGNNGTYNPILRDQFAQSMRALVNLVEIDLASTYKQASRAYGTAAITPFGTAGDFTDFAQMHLILDDNGCPQADRHMVLSGAAIANIRGKQSSLFKVNEAGSDDLLRRGVLGDVEGWAIHNSAQVVSHTKGTGTAYQANGALAVGATSLTVDTGANTMVAGDVVTIANGTPADSNKYVVGTTLAAGTVIINKPGLISSHIDNDAFTIGGSYKANMVFQRNAIHLVTRAPAMPDGGDMASDVLEVVDPISGLAFQVALYKMYRRVRYEVGLAWGWQAVKSEFIANLLG